jgi:hypothetical protein
LSPDLSDGPPPVRRRGFILPAPLSFVQQVD